MRISGAALLATLTLAIAAACSDTATGPSGDRGLLGGEKPAGTAKPGNSSDTGSTPAPWPRTVNGTVNGVTFTPGGPDSIKFERLGGATVRLFQAIEPAPSSSGEPATRLYATATTNAQGEFTFEALPEGSYKLEVVAPAGSGYLNTSIWFVPQYADWQIGVSLFKEQ